MADASKAHKLKLANSRKRFKELQELKKKKSSEQNDSTSEPSVHPNHTPLDSLTSSTHSSVNGTIENLGDPGSTSQLLNYFDNKNDASFFDDLSHAERERSEAAIENTSYDYMSSMSPQTTMMQDMVSDMVASPEVQTNYSLFSRDYAQSYLSETQHIIRPNRDDLSVDNDEIKQNEIYEMHNPAEPSPFQFEPENYGNFSNYMQNSKMKQSDNLTTADEIDISSEMARVEVQHSSVESLKQLSSQMAELIEPEYSNYSGSITDLEKRNLELAALFDQEKLKNEQQTILINDLQARISKMETDNYNREQQDNLNASNDLSKLRDELQCHIQTVGLLVAEKTELSASVGHLELTFKQKNVECEELQTRLKASRSRVAELEREVNVLKSEKGRLEKLECEQIEKAVILSKEYERVKEQKEELLQDLLEVREKLKNNAEDNLQLQQRNQELSSKLSLAEIKIQQIASGEQSNVDDQVEKLMQEKFELEKQILNLNLSLKNITKERDDSSLQYQQYSQQLNAQITSLSNHLEHLQHEYETLSTRDQNRIKHISELERQLQNLQNEQMNFATSKPNGDPNFKAEFDSLKELCIQLQMEKSTMEENLTKTFNEKEMLLKELEAKNDSLSQLETMVEQLRGNQPDSVKLLATMESDKVAAARAIQQNKQLKEQMESMQEVFTKMDQDKVDLTEKLNREQVDNRELLEKLQKVELQLQRLTDAIEIKDRELSHMRQSSVDAERLSLQHEQLSDRLSHYEARDSSFVPLQNELQEARQTIVRLTNELNLLNSQRQMENGDRPVELDDVNPPIDKTDLNQNDNSTTDANTLDKEAAMLHLEEKFNKTMQDIADLTEEKQRLEHLVLQLQGETETIGEYVALYQQQRMVLKQRALEKDQQLKQLASDKEQMKVKLEKLNELIKKLVTEKVEVPKELLSERDALISQSDDHSEIHELDERLDKLELKDQATGSETAEEIIALLTEIKQSNLVRYDESVHHCAYCSGQLITV